VDSIALVDAPQQLLGVTELRLRGLLPGQLTLFAPRAIGRARGPRDRILEGTLESLGEVLSLARIHRYPVFMAGQAFNRALSTRMIRRSRFHTLALPTPGAFIYRGAGDPHVSRQLYWLDDGSMSSSSVAIASDYDPQSIWQSLASRIAGHPSPSARNTYFTAYPDRLGAYRVVPNDFSYLAAHFFARRPREHRGLTSSVYVDTHHKGIPMEVAQMLLKAVRDQLGATSYMPHPFTPTELSRYAELELGMRTLRPNTPLELWSLTTHISSNLYLAPGSTWRTIELLKTCRDWPHSVHFVGLAAWFYARSRAFLDPKDSISARGRIYERAEEVYLSNGRESPVQLAP